MDNNKNLVLAQASGALGGAWQQNPPMNSPIDVPSDAWYVVERGARVVPTYEIMIKARESIKVSVRDVEVEIDCKGITFNFKLLDLELVIDPRYNSAVLKKRDEVVAVSDKVRYYGVDMAATDFAMFVKKSVKELIEEAVATVGL